MAFLLFTFENRVRTSVFCFLVFAIFANSEGCEPERCVGNGREWRYRQIEMEKQKITQLLLV